MKTQRPLALLLVLFIALMSIGSLPVPTDIRPNIAALSSVHGQDGVGIFVTSVRALWTYCVSCAALTVDNITVQATADGGNTRWLRQPGDTAYWNQFPYLYIDGTNGNDENVGFYASPQGSPAALKTNAEWFRRVGSPWQVSANKTVQYKTTYPTDVLNFDVKLAVTTTSGAPIVNIFGPAFTTNSTGTLTAVTPRNNSLNQPFNLQNGSVVTTGDVTRRICITSGPRANACAWVAKSTGSGQWRTSEWGTLSSPDAIMTPVTPQVGDAYAIQSASSQLFFDHVTVAPMAGNTFVNGEPEVNFVGIDFSSAQHNTNPPITNGGAGLIFQLCHFSNGGLVIFTNCFEGDNASCYTDLENSMCGDNTVGTVSNIDFRTGVWTENFIDAGLYFGNNGAFMGGGYSPDNNMLCQGPFSQPVANLFGTIHGGPFGVMDFHVAGVIVGDGVIGLERGQLTTLPGTIWGTTTTGGAYGALVDGVLRYQSYASPITITGPAGDLEMDDSTVGRSWNELAGAYTASTTLSWTAIQSGVLNNNVHDLLRGASVYRSAGSQEP